MTKSWFTEKYPKHTCNQCTLAHSLIPTIQGLQTLPDGSTEWTTRLPFEVIGEIRGVARPGRDTGLDTPVHILVFLWGIPGSNTPRASSMIYLN